MTVPDSSSISQPNTRHLLTTSCHQRPASALNIKHADQVFVSPVFTSPVPSTEEVTGDQNWVKIMFYLYANETTWESSQCRWFPLRSILRVLALWGERTWVFNKTCGHPKYAKYFPAPHAARCCYMTKSLVKGINIEVTTFRSKLLRESYTMFPPSFLLTGIQTWW